MLRDRERLGLARPSANDYFDTINSARDKVNPVLHLMSHSVELNPKLGGVLTNEEIGGLGLLLGELLEEVFTAVDGLHDICKETRGTEKVKKAEQKTA